MITIPFKIFPSFTQEVTIEETPYVFRFDWNSRWQFWRMDISDREGNPLILGRKLVLYYELLKQFPDRGLPKGELYVIDPSLTNFSKITQFDFVNNRCSLVYFEESDFAI